MKTIWKYEVDPVLSKITTPRGGSVLTAAFQGEEICVWVEVDSQQPADEVHIIEVFGTGWAIPEDGLQRRYIGTVFLRGLVFHIYEQKDQSITAS